jgi:hypothetical protein
MTLSCFVFLVLRNDVTDRHVHVPVDLSVQQLDHFRLLQHLLW